MNNTLVWLVVAVVAVIVLYVLATSRKSAVGGVIKRGRKGQIVINLTQLRRKRRRW